ncbi:MAG: hypothetical protein QOI91_1464 [Solirubrobacteraceae bacterium]|jgi:hypothetical protein|nr:hypothetical protein [Solirubrobacteraceae bacterium]
MSHISLPRVRRLALIALGVAIAALMVAAFYANHESASANPQPADKVAVSSNTATVSGPGEEVELLRATLKTSSPADLILAVTAECTIATDVTTTGNDDESAQGKVQIWIEIDGNPVPVSSNPAPDNGKVTFCDRAHHRMTTTLDTSSTIRTLDSTGTANAFNWTKLNLGNGAHTIVVKGKLTETATNTNTADAAVGKRTLTVIPAKLANDAVI